MSRLVLIDGNAILHRAFYALPDTLTLRDGTPVNAVYGFTSMLLKVIQDLQPSFVICSFDLPKPTFRDELYADYRAQRPPTPDKLVSQIEMVKTVVKAFGIPIYEVEGYEADDVIGTLAKQACETRNSKLEIRNKSQIQNSKPEINNLAIEPQTTPVSHRRVQGRQRSNPTIETIIVTGDRDLLQLVDEHTKCYMPVKGLSQAKLYGVKEVEEKYGIAPEQMVDYKALVGDPSDNYPGVKGIGPKTARKLLEEHKTLENIYTTIQKKDQRSLVNFLQDKIVGALKDYREDALLAKKLAKIVTYVPIALTLENAKLGKLANPATERLFKKLAFKTLLQRIRKMSGSSSADSLKSNAPQKQNTEENDQLTML